ncbi:MAG: hypothetical protein Q9184_006993, partial [Pyrenodesmia sp. 2 TL-2023]
DHLLAAAAVDLKQTPRFVEAVRSYETRKLLSRLYGRESSAEGLFLKTAKNDFLFPGSTSISIALQAFIGAAVYERIFEAPVDPFFTDAEPSRTSAAIEGQGSKETSFLWTGSKQEGFLPYEQFISKDLPALYALTVREWKYTVAERHFQQEAGKKALELLDDLKPFFQDNRIEADDETLKRWVNDLKEVFVLSLKLRAKTALEPESLRFRWFPAGASYEPSSMSAASNDQTPPTGRILIQLWSGLFRVVERTKTGPCHVEQPVYPALVIRADSTFSREEEGPIEE